VKVRGVRLQPDVGGKKFRPCRPAKAGRHTYTAGPALIVMLAIVISAASAAAQTPLSGDVTIQADYLPNREHTTELRARVYAEEVLDPTPKLLFTISGFAEGLLARRSVRVSPNTPFDASASTHDRKNVGDAIVRVQEASVAYKAERFELLGGFTRVVWGRLDELQPTDVINPLDVSRFFFEGRNEARLPVALLRARALFGENASLEGIYVPFFRRGRFDQLDEPTSPFNLEASLQPELSACLAIGCPSVLPTSIERHEPSASFANAQGGARLSATTGRVDWSVSAWRGFESFGLGEFAIAPQAAVASIDIVHPRFTMLGGDFETVRGEWGIRGEAAAFIDDSFQDPVLQVVPGSSIDAGVGVDRKAGDYRVSGTVLFHHESYDRPVVAESGRDDVSLVLSADRSFTRERYNVRSFGVYNTTEGSAFFRGIVSAKLRDNLALEGSAGWFAGDGRDLIGRFADSDFIYARLKYYF
jgi:hypothetical protein